MSSSRQGRPSVTSKPEEVWQVITFTRPFFTPLFATSSSTWGVMSMASSALRLCTLIFSSLMIIGTVPLARGPGLNSQQFFRVGAQDLFQARFRQSQRLDGLHHILDFYARVIGAEDNLIAQAPLEQRDG